MTLSSDITKERNSSIQIEKVEMSVRRNDHVAVRLEVIQSSSKTPVVFGQIRCFDVFVQRSPVISVILYLNGSSVIWLRKSLTFEQRQKWLTRFWIFDDKKGQIIDISTLTIQFWLTMCITWKLNGNAPWNETEMMTYIGCARNRISDYTVNKSAIFLAKRGVKCLACCIQTPPRSTIATMPFNWASTLVARCCR